MKALIDTEVYLFRAAAACEIETEWAADDWTYLCRHGDAQAQFQDMIGEIRDTLPDHRPVLVFSDGPSFRYGVWPQYKANRKKYRKPAGYRQLVEWVAKAAPARGWEVVRLQDIEGDDVLGVLRDAGTHLAMSGALGEVLATPAAGYGFVYHLELALLFATLVVIGPLATRRATPAPIPDHEPPPRFGLADFPG